MKPGPIITKFTHLVIIGDIKQDSFDKTGLFSCFKLAKTAKTNSAPRKINENEATVVHDCGSVRNNSKPKPKNIDKGHRCHVLNNIR